MTHAMYSKGMAGFTHLLRPSRQVELVLRNWRQGMSAQAEARGSGRAFTLLEMLVVLIVMGVLASIAVPRYADSITHQRVVAAARRVVADMSLAQRQARFSATAQTVAFDVTAGSYALADLPHPDHAGSKYEVVLSKEPYQATIVSADFGGDPEVIFDIYGMPDSGGTVVIQAGKRQKTLTWDSGTGQLVLPESPGEIPVLPPDVVVD